MKIGEPSLYWTSLLKEATTKLVFIFRYEKLYLLFGHTKVENYL